MPDDYTVLNPGALGDTMDEEGVAYPSAPTIRKRARVVIGGASAAELVRILNSAPAGTEYGLVVRNIPSGTQPVSGTLSVANFPATQPVSGIVALDAASLAALETISVANFPATQTVAGTVALDAASLAALETVTVANVTENAPVTLTSRMLAKQPFDSTYRLWMDAGRTDYIFLAENLAAKAAADVDFRGVRIPLDAAGAPSGEVEVSTAFQWSTRATGGGGTWT